MIGKLSDRVRFICDVWQPPQMLFFWVPSFSICMRLQVAGLQYLVSQRQNCPQHSGGSYIYSQ